MLECSDRPLRYGFGENWARFAEDALNETRIEAAESSLRRMLMRDSLCGAMFLDIGSGSGLFSLAAVRLGARKVVSFDVDPDSVRTTTALRKKHGDPENWVVLSGSILDRTFVSRLERADIVYSWGVLHHTGSMWTAIDQAADLVQPRGVLAIAIYNDVERRFGGSAMWSRVKRFYNKAHPTIRRSMEFGYLSGLLLRRLVSGRNPIRLYKEYDTDGRGMSLLHDVRDWLGGYPYEYATAGQVFRHVNGNHGMALTYLDTHDGHGCNEFVFERANTRDTHVEDLKE